MKTRFYSALIGVFLFVSYAQAAQLICQSEDKKGEFFLETLNGNQNAKVFKTYWGDELSTVYVLANSKTENSKLIESYSLAYSMYSSGTDKTFKLSYKNFNPNAKVVEVVHFGKTYRCE